MQELRAIRVEGVAQTQLASACPFGPHIQRHSARHSGWHTKTLAACDAQSNHSLDGRGLGKYQYVFCF